MKTLRNLREAKEDYKLAPQVTELNEAFDETDDVGNTLVALNHLASIADDLYTVIGDGDVKVTPDEIDSILSAYDILSEIHDKYDDMFVMPSQEYDLDGLDVEVSEEVKLQVEELELAEAAAWQMMMKTLTDLGFKKTEPSKDTWQPVTPKREVQHMFGIPMRAGKWADVFFVIFGDDNDKPYAIIDSEGRMNFAELGKALAELKKRAKIAEEFDALTLDEANLDEAKYSFQNKMSGKVRTINANNDADAITKMNKVHPVGDDALKSAGVTSVDQWFKKYYKIFKEDVDLNETPGGPTVLQKLKASLSGFQAKLDSGKYPDSEKDFKKMIARLEDQIKKYSVKKEETELDEAPMIDQEGKTCPKCNKGKYKDNAPDGYVRCDSCGDKAKRFQPEIPLSKTKGGKRILSAFKKEDVDQLDEVKVSITKWNLSKGVEGQFRMEVIGQDRSAAAKILDKVLPSAKYNLFDDQFGFKSTAERDAASAALVKFYSAIKEWQTNEIPLGTISEEFDESKFRRLAMTGLVPDTDIALIIRAMKNLDAGKTLDMKQKNLIANTFQSLIGLVTGDVSVFTKIQGAIKKDTANAK